VARQLLGMTLASDLGGERVSGIIVETEAYLGVHDPASHAWRGQRHAGHLGVWGPDRSWYVYRSYGLHWCLNVTAPSDDDGAAVLIRAVHPAAGLPVMRRRRGPVEDRNLANGPGKLTQAFAITVASDGLRAGRRGPLRLLPGREVPPGQIDVTPRIGISRAVEWPLRFLLCRPGD